MQTFLNTVVHDLLSKRDAFPNCTIILPSKRAGVFLKNEFKKSASETLFLPKIISIEEFIEELSSLSTIDTVTLIFEFYKTYLKHTSSSEKDNFDTFCNWASILLNDFNEIDRHLIDAENLFSYLTDIKRLEGVLGARERTTMIHNQVTLYENFNRYYTALKDHLLEQNLGYQGLQYREAIENLPIFIETIASQHFIFVGFNALNKAEEHLFNELLEHNLATIYWDIDKTLFDTDDNCTTFIKSYFEQWPYYQSNPYKDISGYFSQEKAIHIVGAPKNITQVKYVSQILSSFEKENYNSTACVLADESLLVPILNSLPESVDGVNITMGYELQHIPLFPVFTQLFKLHLYKKGERYYYKHVIDFFRMPALRSLLEHSTSVEEIIQTITKNNYVYLSFEQLQRLLANNELNDILFLFNDWKENASFAIDSCLQLIEILKIKSSEALHKEYLFRFFRIFNQLQSLNKKYDFIKDLKILHSFYLQVLKKEALSFKGEPLSGLQIMGMLETRVLDFKNLIITSVNEGILPSGKTENSFIPYDIKIEKGLPTYKEKDAIFAYHFFRLLQRAENVYIIYNTENDSYGSGEPSRFITQLELYKEYDITKSIANPIISQLKEIDRSVEKNALFIDRLQQIAHNGFSPTALLSYVLNPMEFYKQKILKIKDLDLVEETVAANTLGTVIHKALENLYTPFIGKALTASDVSIMLKSTSEEVHNSFANEYKNGDINRGKNLIISSVANQFVQNFLHKELEAIKNGDSVKILALEYDLETTIKIDALTYPVKLKGQADRIDEVNGILRIIDYKTGRVDQNKLIIKNWEELTLDYEKYSKSFQVLFYAYVYTQMKQVNMDVQPLESGIISFKNLTAGFMKVNKGVVTTDDLNNFKLQLEELLLKIFDHKQPIIDNNISYD